MQPKGKIESFTPLGKRIVAKKLIDSEEHIMDGIVIPDTIAKKDPVENGIPGMKMELVSKSDTCDQEARSLKPGDKIYVRPYAFEQIRFNEGLFYIIMEEDIRGSFND